jgi:UDP-perosamine 4-acetyltransferase
VSEPSTHGIVIVGAGGHARVCIEVLDSAGQTVDVCLGGPDSGEFCLDVPVLSRADGAEVLFADGYRRAFVAIGANGLRQKLSEEMLALGFELVTAISPHAVVSRSATIGSGTVVMAGAVVNAKTVIGRSAIINTGAVIDHDNSIGDYAHVAPQCGLAGNVSVGARAFLGVGCSVIPGCTIGHDAIVGAGSVVIGDIRSQVTVVGVPAHVVSDHAKDGQQ